MNTPQNIIGMQKLSPTSPRTKQTPRKNTNPIRTTSLSPAVQTSSQSVVPQIDTKVTNPSINSSSPAKPTISSFAAGNAGALKPTAGSVASSTTPQKTSVAAAVSKASPTSTKPVQSTANTTLNSVDNKSNVSTPKAEMALVPNKSTPQLATTQLSKSQEAKDQKSQKSENIKSEKAIEVTKSESTLANPNRTDPSANKQRESKLKQNASQNATTQNTNQSALQEKNNKESNASNATKSLPDQVIEMAVVKIPKAPPKSTSAPNTADAKVKRNRFKTIPYQSPTPEFELVSKISANEAINAHKKKVDDDKLTLFYK